MTTVVTIDGPSGSGKGTIAALLADRLGWSVLDSGALYRIVGYCVDHDGIGFDNADKITEISKSLDVRFDHGRVLLAGQDITDAIRTETAGNNASKVAAIPSVREALLQWQRDCARGRGLVADGRDMGTVVFPAAPLKIFLTASAGERALRRHKQLKEKGIDVSIPRLTSEIEERDKRDRERSIAPLLPAEDAIVIDSTEMGINDVVEQIFESLQAIQKSE